MFPARMHGKDDRFSKENALPVPGDARGESPDARIGSFGEGAGQPGDALLRRFFAPHALQRPCELHGEQDRRGGHREDVGHRLGQENR